MRTSDLSTEQRAVLGAVARMEVYRDHEGADWRLPLHGRTFPVRMDGPVIGELLTAGLIVLPPVTNPRLDRMFEVTDKALEA